MFSFIGLYRKLLQKNYPENTEQKALAENTDLGERSETVKYKICSYTYGQDAHLHCSSTLHYPL